MLPVEILLNNRGPSLAAPQVAPDIFDQLGLVLCPASADGVALDVLIQKFVRIQFRAVARQEKQSNGLLPFFDPIKNCSGSMYWVPVNDQEYRGFILSDQAAHEIDKHLGVEASFENHKVQVSQIGNRRNHVAAKALARNLDDWSIPFDSPSAAHGVVAAQPHFIAPVNSGTCLLGLLLDGWILGLQPVLNLGSVLFVCSANRLLRTEAPASQISTDCTQCQGYSEFSFNECPDSLASPESERQAQLVRIFATDQPSSPGCLKTLELTAASRPPLGLGLESLFPVLLVSFQPFPDRDSGYAKEFGSLDLRFPIQNSLDSEPSDVFLSLGWKLACIGGLHGSDCTQFFHEC